MVVTIRMNHKWLVKCVSVPKNQQQWAVSFLSGVYPSSRHYLKNWENLFSTSGFSRIGIPLHCDVR
jgi:hypothetical protein